jgi:YD repeat-containing protein
VTIRRRILLRRGTASQWSTANPVLAAGEPGWDRVSRVLKIGDGTTAWSGLPAAFTAAGDTPASSYTYNGDGTVATETVAGVVTTYTYNGDGTVATSTRAGVTRTYTYNADGTIASVA